MELVQVDGELLDHPHNKLRQQGRAGGPLGMGREGLAVVEHDVAKQNSQCTCVAEVASRG
jgi:hypothetical protein